MFNAPTDTFANRFKDVYIARQDKVEYDDYNNQIKTYQKPFFYGKKNYQPLDWRNLQAYKEVYGQINNNVVQMLVDYTDRGKFKEFDLAYLYGATPKGETINGENANYIVKAFREQNTKIMVIFEEIIKEDKQ
jgi:hypothetical protein